MDFDIFYADFVQASGIGLGDFRIIKAYCYADAEKEAAKYAAAHNLKIKSIF